MLTIKEYIERLSDPFLREQITEINLTFDKQDSAEQQAEEKRLWEKFFALLKERLDIYRITTVKLTGFQQLTYADFSHLVSHVQYLHLHGCFLLSTPEFSPFKNVASLLVLDLQKTKGVTKDIVAYIVTQSPALVEVNLAYCDISGNVTDCFTSRAIANLNLTGINIAPNNIEKILTTLQNAYLSGTLKTLLKPPEFVITREQLGKDINLKILFKKFSSYLPNSLLSEATSEANSSPIQPIIIRESTSTSSQHRARSRTAPVNRSESCDESEMEKAAKERRALSVQAHIRKATKDKASLIKISPLPSFHSPENTHTLKTPSSETLSTPTSESSVPPQNNM